MQQNGKFKGSNTNQETNKLSNILTLHIKIFKELMKLKAGRNSI